MANKAEKASTKRKPEADEEEGGELVLLVEEKVIREKYGSPEETIAKYRDQYLAITVKGVDDHEGYNVAKEAYKAVRSQRKIVEDTRKGMKAGVLETGRIIDGRAKEIFSLLEPIELHLKQQLEAVDNEKKRIETEEANRVSNMVAARQKTLFDNGMMFDGQYYKLGDVILSASGLYEATEEEWTKFVEQVKVAAAAKKAADEKAENDKRELEKLREEARNRMINERTARLNLLGYEAKGNVFVYEHDGYRDTLNPEVLWMLPDDDFARTLEERREAIAEAGRKQTRYNERVAKVLEMGLQWNGANEYRFGTQPSVVVTLAQLTNWPEADFQAFVNNATKTIDSIKQDALNEAEAAKTDADKLGEFRKRIEDLKKTAPTVQSRGASKKVKDALRSLGEAINHLT